jgi:hypothetical protein
MPNVHPTQQPLAERQQWPKLSETLPFTRSPGTCQSCGAMQLGDLVEFHRWIECDEWERPTGVVVILCLRCTQDLIPEHPRLYQSIDKWSPHCGTMALCSLCKYRKDLDCTHPDLKKNGGAGLRVDVNNPTRVHLNYGGGRGRFAWMFDGPPKACAGREEA